MDLIENPRALQRWIRTGSVFVILIEQFHDETNPVSRPQDNGSMTSQHLFQLLSLKDVESMVNVMEDSGIHLIK